MPCCLFSAAPCYNAFVDVLLIYLATCAILLQLCSLVYCYKPQEQKDGTFTGVLTSSDGTILVVTVS